MDITMCSGKGGDFKERCFRFTAKPSDRQSYFVNPPIKDGKCDLFWGENQENILKMLQDIVKNQNKSDDKL